MKITKAIIPAAGLGTRFLPATKSQPKEMLTVVDKPVIQYIIEEAVDSGIKQIFLITSHTKKSLEDYFDYNFELEERLKKTGKTDALKSIRRLHDLAEFIFIRQKQPKGTGDAILCAKDFVKNEPCAIMFGDDIIDGESPCLGQLIKVFKKYNGPVIGVKRIKRSEIKNFGSTKVIPLEKRVYQVQKIVEKPKPEEAPSNLGIVGRYIITPEFLKELVLARPQKGGEIWINSAFESLFIKKKPIYACEFEGDWYTIGDKQGFLQANIALGLKDKEMGEGLRRFLKKIKF